MKKQIALVVTLVTTLGVLAGCTTKQVSTSKAHTTNLATVIAPKQLSQTPLKWDNRRALVLDEFIKTWAKGFKPHRHFTRYFPGVAGSNYLGYNYPQDLSKRNIIYQGGHMKLGISKAGEDIYNYNVVAIYSDASNANTKNADHLYLFTLHQGKPEIFVTYTPKNPRANLLYVKHSKSKALNEIFTQLVNANSTMVAKLAPDTQWPQVTYKGMHFDYRQIGAMVEAYFSLSDTKMSTIAHEENFSIMHVKKGPLRVGYYNLSPKLAYTYNNNEVIMTSNDLTTPNATIKLADLIATTYNTVGQQRDINRAALLINLKP